MFICCRCNLMMFYDWSECAVSVLGTTKHSSCNCIDSCQYSCIFFTVSEKGIVESHTGLEVVRVVEWTGERFERPSCDHGLCLIVVQLKIVFKHPRLHSKHWFTTSFLQPLPYLVTPYVPQNCQLTSSFWLVLKQ